MPSSPHRLFARLFVAWLLAMLALLPVQSWAQAGRWLVVRGAEQPVRLEQASVDVDIGAGTAAATVELVFRNPNARVLEGQLTFPLAPGQRVTGFALDVGGEMRPAVPVEKTRGRQVFEEVVRRGVDPGLLEATEGENFRLRLYPIPAQGTRRVRVTLAQVLGRAGGRWNFRLPLPYALEAASLRAAVAVHGVAEAPRLPDAMQAVAFQPMADGYKAELPRAALAGGALAIDGRDERVARAWTGDFADASYFVAEIPVDAKPAPRALPASVVLLWDSSGSGAARRHELEYALLDRYFRAAGDIEVRLVRLRDRAEAPRTYRVHGGDWSALRRELEATVYDGATALGGWAPARGPADIILVTDGLQNYGAGAFPTLPAGQRLFVLNAAAGADTARLSALAQRNGGHLVNLAPDALDAAAQALLQDGARIADLQGEGLAELQAESAEPRDGVVRVAGRRLRPDALLRVVLAGPDGKGGATVQVPVTPASPRQPLAPQLWAGWRIDALQADYDVKRGEIARLSKRFGIVTRDASLIVLETVADYVRYDITPPESLRVPFEQMKALRGGGVADARNRHLERIVREVDEKEAWWNTVFPKDAPPPPASPKGVVINGREVVDSIVAEDVGRFPDVNVASALNARAAPPPPPMPAAASSFSQARPVEATALRAPPAPMMRAAAPMAPGAAPIGIALQKWTPDAHYVERMRRADAAQAYAIYLDEKPDFANSTGFYLDVADLLLDKGNRELALRVLSNLAEMDLENRQVLRILGYRLLQAGAPELAVSVFEKVRELAPDEPQSWRDVGLAYAAAKRPQEAVDALYEVVVRDWGGRFPDVELITLADLNAIVAANRGRVDTSRIDPRLLRNLPLDLRVVLTWDADNSDMDLWVTDPNGERCMFSHPRTYQGGRMSRDVMGGYGPEEFSLRVAKPGRYKVEANFYGHRQQVVATSTTLQLILVTGFGTPRAAERRVTLRLRGQGETVFVGEFEVPAGGR